jgi:hypothetical protein
MFIALDKLANQKLKQAIIVVPENTCSSSAARRSSLPIWASRLLATTVVRTADPESFTTTAPKANSSPVHSSGPCKKRQGQPPHR